MPRTRLQARREREHRLKHLITVDMLRSVNRQEVDKPEPKEDFYVNYEELSIAFLGIVKYFQRTEHLVFVASLGMTDKRYLLQFFKKDDE